MSTLSNIPLQALLPLSAYELTDLEKEAGKTHQVFLLADCAAEKDKDAVLNQIAKAFSFPSYFGCNLDALYDCVTDLEPNEKATQPGFVVVLQSLPVTARFDTAERNRLLDVFRDAADFFSDQNVAFRVFYSTAKDASSV
jgi:RNAse (barnase) inhibitor barstar